MRKMSKMSNRITKYKKIKRLLSKENQVKKCGLVPFRYKKIGKGNEGIVYRLDLKRNLSLSLAVKVMKNDENNRREARNYDLFREVVLSGKLPHFPLTWESIHCEEKCHFIDVSEINPEKEKQEWERIKEKECFLLFTELFDGDADDLLKTEKRRKRKKELAVSLLFQMMMALKIINDKHLSHGDLHLHNVLYKKLEENEENVKKKQYFRYVIGDDVYEVKHFSLLFVISDFEKMKPSGTISAHAHDKKWLRTYVPDITFDKGQPLNSIYWDLFILTQSLSYFSKEFKILRNKFLEYTQAYNKTKTGPSIEDIIRDFSSFNKSVISHKKRNEKEKKSKNTFFL